LGHNGIAQFKNVNNHLITNIYSYLETSGGQKYNLDLNVVHFVNTSLNKISVTAYDSCFPTLASNMHCSIVTLRITTECCHLFNVLLSAALLNVLMLRVVMLNELYAWVRIMLPLVPRHFVNFPFGQSTKNHLE
jgi:hypothetical protein